MAQIDHGKSDEISTKEVTIFAIEPYQQSPEFINPGKCSLTREASFVDFSIEKAFAPSLCCFAIALILINIRHDTMVEAGFTGFPGVESLICIEKGTLKIKREVFH